MYRTMRHEVPLYNVIPDALMISMNLPHGCAESDGSNLRIADTEP
jgi:hypothetical protein